MCVLLLRVCCCVFDALLFVFVCCVLVYTYIFVWYTWFDYFVIAVSVFHLLYVYCVDAWCLMCFVGVLVSYGCCVLVDVLVFVVYYVCRCVLFGIFWLVFGVYCSCGV